jgi:hypothetical protein
MNLQYLGDALDHWKGSIFARLQKEGVLKDFAADPMSTDTGPWHAADFHLYADLLQLRADQILRHKTKLRDHRKEYFTEIRHAGDLFVDPDTGIAPTHPGRHDKYITVEEVHQLLGSKSPRLLCIYQHIRGEKTRDRVAKSISALTELNANVSYCSYESPTVAMLFLSRERNRREQVSWYFKKYLGRHSDMRVFSG